MIIVLSFFWGSFVGVLLGRGLRIVDVLLKESSPSPSSFLRLQRAMWAYLFLGRSRCDSCYIQIVWHQNIPLFSYLFLRGKCKSCHQAIPLFLFCIEFLFIGLGLVLHFFEPDFILQLIYLVTATVLVLITVIDLKKLVIPDFLSYALFWLGAGYLFYEQANFLPHLLTAILAYLVLKTLQMIYLIFLKKVALGDADPLLGFALCIWLDIEYLPYCLFLSAVYTMLGIFLVSRSQRSQGVSWSQHYPFGPGMVLGATTCFVYSQII
jgi:prepilin signal peptidase PulO-like enzyme (type II secretory pathway)